MDEVQTQIDTLVKARAILWAKFRNENKKFNAQMREDRAKLVKDVGHKQVEKKVPKKREPRNLLHEV